MKKITYLILSLALLLFNTEITAIGANGFIYAETETGSEGLVYIIKTAEQFDSIRYASTETHFKLGEDIDLEELDYAYIPFTFSRTLDGNGKTININIEQALTNTGLFSTITGKVVITNLTLTGTVKGTTQTGALFGEGGSAILAGSQIINCVNHAQVTGNDQVGGIGGRLYGVGTGRLVFKNNANHGTIEGTTNVGGILGTSASGMAIENSINTALIKGTHALSAAGGIVGWNHANILKCYNTGEVRAINTAGGIVGKNTISGKTIQNCYNTGRITVTGDNSMFGGICGTVTHNASTNQLYELTIQNCYNVGYARNKGLFNPIITNNYTGIAVLSNNFYISPNKESDSSMHTEGQAAPKTVDELTGESILNQLTGFEKSTAAYIFPQIAEIENYTPHPKLHIVTISVSGEEGTVDGSRVRSQVYVEHRGEHSFTAKGNSKTRVQYVIPEGGFPIAVGTAVYEHWVGIITSNVNLMVTFAKYSDPFVPEIVESLDAFYSPKQAEEFYDEQKGMYETEVHGIMFGKVANQIGALHREKYGFLLSKTNVEPNSFNLSYKLHPIINLEGITTPDVEGQFGVRLYGNDVKLGEIYYARPYAIFEGGYEYYGEIKSFEIGTEIMPPKEYIFKDNFERSFTGLPEGWKYFTTRSNGRVDIDTLRGIAGGTSVRLTDTESGQGDIGIRLNIKVPAEAGKEYTVLADAYKHQGTCRVYIEFWNNSDTRIDVLSATDSTEGVWVPMSVTRTAPEGTEYLTVLLLIPSATPGDVSFDNIRVRQTPDLIEGSPKEDNFAYRRTIETNIAYAHAVGGRSRIVDGDMSTTMIELTDKMRAEEQYIAIDLGAAAHFNKVILYENGNRIREFRIDVSEDNNTWQTVHTGTTVGEKKIMEFDTVKGRYVRLVILNAAMGVSINEFEVLNESDLASWPDSQPPVLKSIDLSKPEVVEPVPYSNENFHIYLCLGQSNMNGADEILDDDKVVVEGAYLFNTQNQWEKAQPDMLPKFKTLQGYNRYSSVAVGLSAGMGPTVSFARAMVETLEDTGVGIGIVSNARGGSSIEEWQKGSELYEEAVRRVKAAIESGGVLKGILWLQGESCATKSNYFTYLNDIAEGLREELGAEGENIPFIVSMYPTNLAAANAEIIKVESKIENSGYVLNSGTYAYDGLHYNSESQRLIGIRFAQKFLNMVYGITHDENSLYNMIYGSM